jgi:hypothetical protein
VISPIPHRTRIAKAAGAFVISLGLAFWGWWEQYENNALAKNWYVLLALPALGLWISYRLYRTTETKVLSYTVEAVPVTVRLKRGVSILSGTILRCGIPWSLQYSSDQLSTYWWYVWPVAIPGLAWSAFEFLRVRKHVLVPEAQVEKLRLDQEEKLKEQAAAQLAAEREDRWYFRYPMAALMIFGAYWVVEKKEHLWWLGLLLLLVAAFQARELSLLILAALGVYLLFQGIAALPVSVAVIIGAIIIAGASRR